MDTVVTALDAGGFDVKPVALPPGNGFGNWLFSPLAPIDFRGRWRCSSWPSGSAWFWPLFHSEGDNGRYFDEPAVDAEIERISLLPIDEQPAAWGALDKTIMTDYYPAFIRVFQVAAMLHGSKIGGLNDDNIFAMPTYKDSYVTQ